MSDAIVLTVEGVRTRASTSEALITFALPLEQASSVSDFMGMIGEQVACAFAKVENRSTPAEVKAPHRGHGNYGMQAKALRLSSFFRTPNVWKAVGTDEKFLSWLRAEPCAVCGEYDHFDGGQACEAAHIRRVSNGAGTSIKPPYSAIPLCHEHHMLQHAKGESALGNSAWWDKKRIEYVVAWCWSTMKAELKHESWKDVPPEQLLTWARFNDVDGYLPVEYLEER